MPRFLRPLPWLAVLLAMFLAGCNGPGGESSNPVDDGDSPARDIKGVGQDQPDPTESR